MVRYLGRLQNHLLFVFLLPELIIQLAGFSFGIGLIGLLSDTGFGFHNISGTIAEQKYPALGVSETP